MAVPGLPWVRGCVDAAGRRRRLGEVVRDHDLTRHDLRRECPDLVLDLLGQDRRRWGIGQHDERRSDAVLAQAVVDDATRERARREVADRVVDADVGALDHRLEDVGRVDGALVGVHARGEEALLRGGLEDARVAGRGEREDVLRALAALAERELLASRPGR